MTYFNAVRLPCLLVTFLALATGLPAVPTLPPRDDPTALEAWFRDRGVRREGSVEEKAVFSALRAWFADVESLSETRFDQREGEHSFSQQLWFRLRGKANGELVVVVPTDGANHRGLAWAVAWAAQRVTRPPPISLLFLFTGAERGSATSAGLGSRTFLDDFYPVGPAAVLYLDVDDSSELRLTTESGLYPSPLWMVRGLTEAFQGRNLHPTYTGTAPALFRLDLPERQNALAPWFHRSIPALMVASGPEGRPVVEGLDDFLATMEPGMPAVWDRHYLVFDFGTWKAFWGQNLYLTILLGTMALLLVGYAVASRNLRGSIRVLTKGLWQIPVLFALLFLFLYAGDLTAAFLQGARGMPEFWKSNPLLVWSFKTTVAISLYFVLFLPFRSSPLSRDPDFFAQASLGWLGLTMFAAAALELSFSFYFLWALVCCAVFILIRWAPIRLLALAAGPLWLVKAAWEVLGPSPDTTLTRMVLDAPVAGNFALAVLLFPFLLQVNVWMYGAKHQQSRGHGLQALVQFGVAGVATLFLGLAVLRVPPAKIWETTETPLVMDLGQSSDRVLWAASVDQSAFLDRTVWTLRFTGRDHPERVTMTLKSLDALTVFDCNFPVSLDPAGREARVIIGRQPPLPLVVRLTLPDSTRASVEVQALFQGARDVMATATLELQP